MMIRPHSGARYGVLGARSGRSEGCVHNAGGLGRVLVDRAQVHSRVGTRHYEGNGVGTLAVTFNDNKGKGT